MRSPKTTFSRILPHLDNKSQRARKLEMLHGAVACGVQFESAGCVA